MAVAAKEGSLYLIDRRDGKPPHIWIVLCDPNSVGDYLAISFTDYGNYTANSDIWDEDEPLGDDVALDKASVLHMRYIAVKNQDWLDDLDARYLGQAYPDVLVRARCNLCWFEDQIQPNASVEFYSYKPDWEEECWAEV